MLADDCMFPLHSLHFSATRLLPAENTAEEKLRWSSLSGTNPQSWAGSLLLILMVIRFLALFSLGDSRPADGSGAILGLNKQRVAGSSPAQAFPGGVFASSGFSRFLPHS